jgi:hypothetical protein
MIFVSGLFFGATTTSSRMHRGIVIAFGSSVGAVSARKSGTTMAQ